ncbi:MAG: dynamin family protein, partial [Pseudomonadota bacterium]
MAENKLAHQFAAYSEWRKALVDSICDYRSWLNEQELNDAQIDQRITNLLERLREDKLNVAFVAEFSRGKSELINAIFFADYGQRLLPSSAGRTTMCPTELLYDASKPTSIAMLPIETRSSDATTTEYKRYPDEWKVVDFDVDNNDSMVAAFKEVSSTKRVTAEEAEKFGLYDPNSSDDAMGLNKDGSIDIPCWRYAMINFPHPLLEQGLVILDTPGLNAIGTEPELTLNMLPNAHAVLFILAADTGVTKSEIDVWRQYISGTRWKQKGRLAVLNKIDGLWDELKNEKDIEKEINKQIKTSAELLGLENNQIFPTSAQKGLLAKINGDEALLAQSRLPELEKALSDELIPSKKEIVRDNTKNEIEDLIANSNMILESRVAGVVEQLDELRGLRGKNEDVVEHMMNKVKVDKENFEKGLQRFQA